MESFSDRLKRLRRESADAAPPVEQPPPAIESVGQRRDWLRARLRKRAGASGGRPAAAPLPATQHRPTTGMPRDLVEERNERGAFGLRIIEHAQDHVHGHVPLSEVDHASDLAWLGRDPRLSDLDPRGAVYLDIETTGLSGGAGTWPFMVALGYFEGDRFIMWQGFMRGPHEEEPLLFAVAEKVRAARGLVSFFGKSFDRHRLEDKMRLHKLDPGFDGQPHLDLYYPLNRLYTQRAGWDRVARGAQAPPGGGLVNGKLGTMERALIGLTRKDDLSGAHAPAAWFAFLDQRPHLLEEVFRHNALDVWSLVTLHAHLGRVKSEARPSGEPLPGPRFARALGLAAIARDHGDRDAECAYLELAHARLEARPTQGFLGSSEAVPIRPPAELALWQANALRLAGRAEDALAKYTELEARRQLAPRVLALSAAERAKLLERHAKDYPAALAACEVARAAAVRGLCTPRFRSDLEKRAARLVQRLREAESP